MAEESRHGLSLQLGASYAATLRQSKGCGRALPGHTVSKLTSLRKPTQDSVHSPLVGGQEVLDSWEDADGHVPVCWRIERALPPVLPDPLILVNVTRLNSGGLISELAHLQEGEYDDSYAERLERLFAAQICFHSTSAEAINKWQHLMLHHPGETFTKLPYPPRLAMDVHECGGTEWCSTAELWSALWKECEENNCTNRDSSSAAGRLRGWIIGCSRCLVWKVRIMKELNDVVRVADIGADQLREVRERVKALKDLLGSIDDLCATEHCAVLDSNDILRLASEERASIVHDLQEAEAELGFLSRSSGPTTIPRVAEEMTVVDLIAAMVLPRMVLPWELIGWNQTDLARLLSDRHTALRRAWITDFGQLPQPPQKVKPLKSHPSDCEVNDGQGKGVLRGPGPTLCAASQSEARRHNATNTHEASFHASAVKLLERRSLARANGSYEEADSLRERIWAMGYCVDDTVSGSTLRPSVTEDIEQPCKVISGDSDHKTRQGRKESSLRRVQNQRKRRDQRSKKNRASVFARFIVDNFGLQRLRAGRGVLDVAGGKGALAFELAFTYGVPTTVVDPAPVQLSAHKTKEVIRRALVDPTTASPCGASFKSANGDICDGSEVTSLANWLNAKVAAAAGGVLCARAARLLFSLGLRQRSELFNPAFCEGDGETAVLWREVSVVVGLHADEATEDLVDMSLAYGKPFATVPCCVFPTAFPHRRLDGKPVRSEEEFVRYLASKAPSIGISTMCEVLGRNKVVWTTAI